MHKIMAQDFRSGKKACNFRQFKNPIRFIIRLKSTFFEILLSLGSLKETPSEAKISKNIDFSL